LLPEDDEPLLPFGAGVTCVWGMTTWVGVVLWTVLVPGLVDGVDGACVVAVCDTFGFGGAGLGFRPGTAAAEPTAVIWTCGGPWTLDGLWSWVDTGGGFVFLVDEWPSAYAATNATTATTTAAINIGVAEGPFAPPREARF